MPRPKPKKAAPFEFMFDELEGLEITTKPMFGCLAIYVGDKIVFVQRAKGDPAVDDGVWLATTPAHHESLRRSFPNMRSITVFGPGLTGWQVLPQNADDFEASVAEACALVRAGDDRIGKIPKSRLKAKSGARPAKKKSPKKRR